MEVNQIGIQDYLFYNAWGRVLEELKEYDKADKVYQAGIDRKAQPEDKMREIQTAFQARMWKRIQLQQEQLQSGLLDDPAQNAARENLRTPLGTLKSGSSSVRVYEPAAKGALRCSL